MNTLPRRLSSIGSFDNEDSMSAGVARYITKSFIAVRSILFRLPNRYPSDAIRNTGSTTFTICCIMARSLLCGLAVTVPPGDSFYLRGIKQDLTL